MKKLLIISSYAPPAIGGPQILYNLLKDLPSDRYSILTSFYNIDNLSAQKGTWLNGEYFFYDKPKANKEDRIKNAQDQTSEGKKSSLLLKLKNLARTNKIVWNLIGTPVIFAQIFWIKRTGRAIISRLNPDILLSISDYGPALISTYLLHKKTKKPYIVFLFDIYKGSFHPFPGKILAGIFDKKVIQNAQKVIVTNQGAKDYYSGLYGKKSTEHFEIIHNAISPEPYLPLISPYNPRPPYKIVFTGRIYWPQQRSLQNLIAVVNQISDLDIELHIYCPNTKDYLTKIGVIESDKIKISVASPKEMPMIQSQADILFLPLSWNTKGRAIVDTATPGKLSDYLISGRPILIHSPASTYLVRYAKENNIALVVDEEDMEKLKLGIKKIITDIEYSKTIIKNAQELFYKNHDINKNSNLFLNIFKP